MPCHHSKFHHTGLHPKDSAALEEVTGSRVGNIHLYKHMHAEKRIIVAQTHTHTHAQKCTCAHKDSVLLSL